VSTIVTPPPELLLEPLELLELLELAPLELLLALPEELLDAYCG
jgi:hypothetical protein